MEEMIEADKTGPGNRYVYDKTFQASNRITILYYDFIVE